MKIPGLHLVGDSGALEALPWRPTHYEGIEWLDLAAASEGARGGDSSTGSQTVLIRMAPGCGYPRHRHLGPEDVLVLAGGYSDEDGRTFEAGQFVRYAAGSEHSPTALGSRNESSEPCILFAVAHGGTQVVGRETPSK